MRKMHYIIFNTKLDKFVDKLTSNYNEHINWCWGDTFQLFSEKPIIYLKSARNPDKTLFESHSKILKNHYNLYKNYISPYKNYILIVPFENNKLNFVKAFKL